MNDIGADPQYQAESRAYDEGCRHLLIGQVKMLAALALEQERRSAQTARRPAAHEHDHHDHEYDKALAALLSRAVNLKSEMIYKRRRDSGATT